METADTSSLYINLHTQTAGHTHTQPISHVYIVTCKSPAINANVYSVHVEAALYTCTPLRTHTSIVGCTHTAV